MSKSDRDDQVAEHSATIIDFNVYRMKKCASAVPSSDPSSIASYEVAAALYFFWSWLALVPFALSHLPASIRGPS